VRAVRLPYSRQNVNERDRLAVQEALKSQLITQGPIVDAFEQEFAKRVNAEYAVAFSNGTAALHACLACAGIGPGDEVITTPITFAATANAALYCGAVPVFADVRADGNIDPGALCKAISKKTKALLPVHYSGRPCAMSEIHALARKHELATVEDACHALGAKYKGRRIGSLRGTAMTVFSLHAVKHITSGEGGMVTTNSGRTARKLRAFRSHGAIYNQACKRRGSWFYEIRSLGFNYRLSELHAALGLSQLRRMDGFLEKRRMLALRYEKLLGPDPRIRFLSDQAHAPGSYHLFPILLDTPRLIKQRKSVFDALRAEGIGVQVHYIPLPMQPHFQLNAGAEPGSVPNALDFYKREISIPLFPGMSEADQDSVVQALEKVLDHFDSRGDG